VELMSIGEFSRRSRLSAKALRRYDELGLLPPARVDAASGYRSYETSQLSQARLVAALRQLQMPLADIKTVLSLEPAAAARRVSEHWSAVEVEHAARRDLAGYVANTLHGTESVMYEVALRDIPDRSLLCLRRNVNGRSGAIALGKQFVGIMRERRLPRIPGRAGAPFCIYWSEVSEDSDGPIEWCKPVPDDQAEALASLIPELALRTEPAHEEAFVNLGPGGQATPAQWQLAAGSLFAWPARRDTQQPGHQGDVSVKRADQGRQRAGLRLCGPAGLIIAAGIRAMHESDDLGQRVNAANVAGEHHVWHADSLGRGISWPEH
jgi:DNA-binding transcriptional MerR regulator